MITNIIKQEGKKLSNIFNNKDSLLRQSNENPFIIIKK
jgi:hypothetical protein